MMIKQLKLRLTEEFHNELKLFCVKNNISMQDFVTKALEEKYQAELKKG